MSTPQRIQLRRAKGWRMPAGTVKVDRSSFYGNPFAVVPCTSINTEGTRKGFTVRGFECQFFDDRSAAAELSVKAFRAWIAAPANSKVASAVKLLRRKNLACWCALDQPCHADVLLEIANK